MPEGAGTGWAFKWVPAGCSHGYKRSHLRFDPESKRLFREMAPLLNLKANGSGRLPVLEADHTLVWDLLHGRGISDGERLAVLHAGAKRHANRWFEERFAAVADSIWLRYGIRTVLTGAPSERDLLDEVRRRMKTEPLLVCGELTLLQLAALMERACLYVGNDTGPMHIAAMMGTPAVAIFSARDFARQWYPHGDGHIVLEKTCRAAPASRMSATGTCCAWT